MTFNSIERLGPPFYSVSEVGFVIPPDGSVDVNNRENKLLFFLEADCVLTISDAGEFPVRAGDITVVPRRCVQRYLPGGRGQSARVHALKIAFSLAPQLPPAETARPKKITGDPEQDLSAFVQHHFAEVRHLPGTQDAAIMDIMRGIRVEGEQHRPGIRHRVRSLCTNLVVHVARQLHDAPAKSSAPAAGYGAIVNQTREFLLRNMARDLTLEEVARHVKKSEEHLARVFRRVTGQTVFDYLRTLRLENAKTMLIDSDKTMTEIARRTGFTSLSLFSRNFSQYVGCSPSVYREARAQEVRWQPVVDAAAAGPDKSIQVK
jgi:AraC-like DNA-binding protein